MPNFIVGDMARATLDITDVDAVLVDPGSISLAVKLPSGEMTFPDVTRISVGKYYVDITCAVAGQYLTRWVTGAPYIGAYESEFLVNKSAL